MATEPDPDDALFDDFLAQRGHEDEATTWDRSYNKLQCPECRALHPEGSSSCTVCDWAP
jgi:hypothetical protein